jgi:hypothetical protein
VPTVVRSSPSNNAERVTDVKFATVTARKRVGLRNPRQKAGGRIAFRTVRFTLSYDGPLPSRGTASHKQQIREPLDPQLR